MKVEVVAIADEILRGMILNGNSSYISSALAKLGLKTSRHTVLPDTVDLLDQGLREALSRSDLVISTGGLGPTLDDVTRQVAAKIYGSRFHFDESVAEDLEQRFGGSFPTLKNQATVPSNARILKNKLGTAPGFIFSEKGKTLILLPGPPPEMQPMFQEEVIPYLQRTFPELSHGSTEFIHLGILNENNVDPYLRELQGKYPTLEVGIYPGYGVLTVTLHSADDKILATARQMFCSQFKPYLFDSANGKIEEAVHEWLIRHKKTLAFAESCTGGLLSHKMTSLAGASEYFLGSFVTYCNEMKQKILSVSEDTLRKHGAVSAEVVTEMLAGLFAATGADFGIAVSGMAGPTGGTSEKPVGTIWAAVGERGKKPDVGTFVAKGNRETIINSSSTRLLAVLYRKLVHGIPSFPF